jgi:hypothetical protein
MKLVLKATCPWCHLRVEVHKDAKMKVHFDFVPYRICEGSGKEIRNDKIKAETKH